MEFVEKVDVTKIHFLNQMGYAEYKTYCSNNLKNENDRQASFTMMKRLCEGFIKSRGEMRRLYAYSLTTLLDAGGRLYCGDSIQCLQSKIRGFLMSHTTDIDMKNAHPVILKYVCSLHKIQCPNLDYYIANRDTILSEFDDRNEGKTAFLKAVNDNKPNRKISNRTFKKFEKEMRELQDLILSIPEYQDIKNSVPENKKYNWNGSAINRILCMYENKILQSCISAINQKNNIEICALMFDGLMVYGYHYGNNELLNYIETFVNNQFPNLNMKFDFKEHNTEIQIPDDFIITKSEEMIKAEQEANILKINNLIEEFEKTHLKIINKGMYLIELSDKIILKTRKQLADAYEHLEDVTIEEKSISFINYWTSNNPTIRSKDDMDIYPDESLCPDNIYNLWKPFAGKALIDEQPNFIKNDKAIQFFKTHILTLCDNDVAIANYLEQWIAQMLQFPAVKSNCPILISKEGAGKGTLLTLLKKMVGESKYFETANPNRDVWGQFNTAMADCYLVNLNEIGKKDTADFLGLIKALIVDNELTINTKGVPAYKIQSYHHWIMTTNVEDPMPSTKDDRRFWIIRSSDKLCGNKEYFDECYALLNDPNVIRTMFDYFMGLPDIQDFHLIPKPTTEYQKNIQEANVSICEQWLEHFTSENFDKDEIELFGKDAFNLFETWRKEQNIKFEINAIKLGMKLSNLKINGIQKGKHTDKGKTKIFNIPLLKSHFGIGCLIKMAEDTNLDSDSD
jgi:hypothetical protein